LIAVLGLLAILGCGGSNQDSPKNETSAESDRPAADDGSAADWMGTFTASSASTAADDGSWLRQREKLVVTQASLEFQETSTTGMQDPKLGTATIEIRCKSSSAMLDARSVAAGIPVTCYMSAAGNPGAVLWADSVALPQNGGYSRLQFRADVPGWSITRGDGSEIMLKRD
jgi:hypothetical protein